MSDESRRVPRYDGKPCAVCEGRRYVKRELPNGDTVTKNCPACVPPNASEK